MCVYVYVYIYVCVCVCVCVYIYIYIYIYFQMQAWKQTSSLTLWPIHITHLTPLLLKKKRTNDTTPHLKHRKYHFPPPTITPATKYVPLPSINPYILLHTICWHYVSMSVCNKPHRSTFFLSTTYTPSFITITYKSYNVNTVQITIKNNHHNPPPITQTSQTYHLFP